MKKSTLLIYLCWISMTAIAQSKSKPFEGIIEVTSITKQDSVFRQKSVEAFKKQGWTGLIKSAMADSLCARYYIKQDSVWAETRFNDEEEIDRINFQAGFYADIIDPEKGTRTVLGKTQEIEEFLEKNSNGENWREKIKVSNWFKTDYSKLRRLPQRKEVILGYKCTPYELPSDHPELNSMSVYWIAEDFTFDESQILPYHLNTMVTPRGVIMKMEYSSKDMASEKLVRKITPGPIAPILPRLRSINFGSLDSIQYADEKFNQHLQGKTVEQNPTCPDFFFYPVQSTERVNLYSKKDLGKFILIDQWATWCGPCLKEMPKLQAFQAEHAAVLEVIGFNSGDHRADYVESFIKKYNMSWPQAYAGKLLKAFLNPGKTIPHAVLLDSNMKLRWRGNPAENWEKIAEIIRGN
ncbi:MAG TPA: TlpA disulfide reductase family protein [Haliscomenobacter sp.]|uniref:TlpA family protein disulfide reductase n=1 Tax=Haliscomenobacter sp. TaxID=2717303 RepID=UPI002CC71548|nr:TlpA disulfide reductase family protein [Haliscomenobacter sp.]HOY16383.1 TlpA disulfide reductase family protein [Haliscomenobacter sp.]